MNAPFRQIRAVFNDETIRVYQAYPVQIARAAIAAQTFVSPFKMSRMTWIKPSFTWMMYRCGWGRKSRQEVVLGIDILREGFEWALANSSMSHFDGSMHSSHEEWKELLGASPVRIQWDPERSLKLEPLPWRSLQIGLEGEAVEAYVGRWITRIEDVTPLATEIEAMVAAGDLDGAEKLRPVERPYPLPERVAERIGCRATENQVPGS